MAKRNAKKRSQDSVEGRRADQAEEAYKSASKSVRTQREKGEVPPGYKKVTVKVKASTTPSGRKIPAHVEHRTIKIKDTKGPDTKGQMLAEDDVHALQGTFAIGVDHSTHMKAVGDGMGGNSPKDPGATAADSAPANPTSYGAFGNSRDPYGRFGNLANFSSEKLTEIVAQRASEIYRDETSSQTPQKQRQEQAASQALREVEIAYRSTSHPKPQRVAGTSSFKGMRGLSTERLNMGNVMSVAFSPKITKLSKKEQEQRFPRKPKTKTNVHKTHVSEALKRPKSAPKQGAWDPKKLQAATKAAEDRKNKLEPGQTVAKSKVSAQQFLRTLSPEESKWVQGQMDQANGLFFGAKNNKVPGAYRRWQRYVNARQAGYSDRDNISDWLKADTRGRARTNPNRKDKAATDKMIKDRYTKGIVKPEGTKPRDRYKSLAPSHEDFGVGIRVPGIPSDRELKDAYPDKSDREIFEMRQSAIQSVDELMKNQREAHETRHAEVLGRSASESGANNEDRVVFFTTSTGWPAVSVGANSLVGQYIIKKRKKMVYDNRQASRAQLKGEFPAAVRDQHIIEVATGLSVGAQGRYGAFKHTGYRVGSKKSKGYGKVLPVGSQILRDSSGQPLYDRNGSVRYTEGFTRPFDIRPSNEVGLRMYVG